MTFRTAVTMRRRRRKQRNGMFVTQVRWVLSYRDPQNRKRTQRFFERKEEALTARDEVVLSVAKGGFQSDRKGRRLTVKDAIHNWLGARANEVGARTLKDYQRVVRYVVGPMPPRDPRRKLTTEDRRSEVETRHRCITSPSRRRKLACQLSMLNGEQLR